MCQGLQPSLGESLAESLNSLIASRRSPGGPVLELIIEGEERELPEAYRLTIYRIAQEALSNALKHSGSKQIQIRLSTQADRIELLVRDWGRGFDPATSPSGHGLPGIRHRVGLLGGEVNLEALPGQGTAIRVMIPISSQTLQRPSPGAMPQSRAG